MDYLFRIFIISIIYSLHGGDCDNLNVDESKDFNLCARLHVNQLFKLKDDVQKKLTKSYQNVAEDLSIRANHKKNQLKAIKIFQRELNETELSFYESVLGLKRILKGDYKSLRKLESASKQRLDELRKAALQEEEEYNEILNAEKEEIIELKKLGNKTSKGTMIRKFVGNLLEDISVEADRLETQLDDLAFEKTMNKDGVSIETVVRLRDSEDDDSLNAQDDTGNGGVIMLIDSHSNQFTLSKAKDSTITHFSHGFLKDIIYIVTLSYVFGFVCAGLKLPMLFAYVVTGIVLGPSGFNVLKSIVQIETLGEFGVFFTLFVTGMDFSPEKISKVWKVSLYSNCAIIGLILLCGLVFGSVLGILPQQSLFVAACVSLSSTSVMIKVISSHQQFQGKDHKDGAPSMNYIDVLLGILIIQDMVLSIIIGVLPALAGHKESSKYSLAIIPNQGMLHNFLHKTGGDSGLFLMAWIVMEVLFALALLCAICYMFTKHCMAKFFRFMQSTGSEEMSLMGTLFLMFVTLMLTEQLGISMELGCFVCGVLICTQGEAITMQVKSLVDPLFHLFSCLFFASVGLHVFPTFVMAELAIMVPITIMIVGTKFCISSGVLAYLIPSCDKTKWIVAAGLAQISEFSFLLGSRARRFGFISREVYLIILSVTTLSLMLSPLVWKVAMRLVLAQGEFNVKQLLPRFRLT